MNVTEIIEAVSSAIESAAAAVNVTMPVAEIAAYAMTSVFAAGDVIKVAVPYTTAGVAFSVVAVVITIVLIGRVWNFLRWVVWLALLPVRAVMYVLKARTVDAPYRKEPR